MNTDFLVVVANVKIDENKCFKDLRTTYISKLRAEFGDLGLTAAVCDHSNPKMYSHLDIVKLICRNEYF